MVSQIENVNKGNKPSDNEAEFSFDELFFSRTDEKGIILSGNSIFQRISMYEWNELLKKPHNIIRHQEMPKAVFWLLWDTIKKGLPIGAYVKNKAKDGRYYWVFAIVTPIENGYLSVRLKPSSPVFGVIKEEYSGLLAKELKEKLKPNESGKLVLTRLNELGFSSYAAFMSAALSNEILSRDKALGKKDNQRIHIFIKLQEFAKELLKQAELIFNAYAMNEYVPLNLRVQAAQLGESGKTIDVISNNYNVISKEIKIGMDEFISAAKLVFETINSGLFLVATAEIQKEVWENFSKEPENPGVNNEQEAKLLSEQQKAYNKKAFDGLATIGDNAKKFRESCLNMKRLVSALEVTRIMGKVESAQISTSKDGLNELINDLELFQKTVMDSLKGIERLNKDVQFNVENLLKL